MGAIKEFSHHETLLDFIDLVIDSAKAIEQSYKTPSEMFGDGLVNGTRSSTPDKIIRNAIREASKIFAAKFEEISDEDGLVSVLRLVNDDEASKLAHEVARGLMQTDYHYMYEKDW